MKYISWFRIIIYWTLAFVNNVRNEELIKQFGIRVRLLRKEKGYTMEKLAGLAGVDYRQLSYIELGQVNITISSIFALSKALNLSISELVNLDGF